MELSVLCVLSKQSTTEQHPQFSRVLLCILVLPQISVLLPRPLEYSYHLLWFPCIAMELIFKAFSVLKPSFKGNLPVRERAECLCSGKHADTYQCVGIRRWVLFGGSREFSWLSCHMRTQGAGAIREPESHHRHWLYYTVNLEFSPGL